MPKSPDLVPVAGGEAQVGQEDDGGDRSAALEENSRNRTHDLAENKQEDMVAKKECRIFSPFQDEIPRSVRNDRPGKVCQQPTKSKIPRLRLLWLLE